MVTTTVWTPYATATLNGVEIEGVRRARVISTFSDPVTKIYVSCYPKIEWEEGDEITVTIGGGTNNLLSATGNVYTSDASNAAELYELHGRGPLFRAQRYMNNVAGGLTLDDLTGGPATDEAIVMAVLDLVDVDYDPLRIGGTGIVRGSLAPAAYTWRQGETALAYLMRLSKASLGWRMVEVPGVAAAEVVQRVRVLGRPQVTAQYFMTEGVDIFGGAKNSRDVLGRYTAVTVTGFDYGSGDGPVSFSDPDPTPAGVEPYVYGSEMIERALEDDAGSGVSAESVATDFVIPEVDRVSIRVSGIKTPRDELFAPGQTHQIDSDRLDLADENVWLHTVTRECDERWFTQTLDYIGGGEAQGGYTGPGGPTYLFPSPAAITISAVLDGVIASLQPDAVTRPIVATEPTVVLRTTLVPDPATIPISVPSVTL